MKKKSKKYTGLVQENGFGPAHLHSLLRLVKVAAKTVHLARRKKGHCNKYDLTTGTCF
jgi:hypothetical protein